MAVPQFIQPCGPNAEKEEKGRGLRRREEAGSSALPMRVIGNGIAGWGG